MENQNEYLSKVLVLQMRAIFATSMLVLFPALGAPALSAQESDEDQTRVALKGKVEFDGSPLKGVKVVFESADESAQYVGTTDANGKFTIADVDGQRGIPIGNYKVILSSEQQDSDFAKLETPPSTKVKVDDGDNTFVFAVGASGKLSGIEHSVIKKNNRMEEGMQEALQAEDAVAPDPHVLYLQTYVRVETAFVRRVCELGDQQVQEFAKMDAGWIKERIQDNAWRRPGIMDNFARMFLGANEARPPRHPQSPDEMLAKVQQQIDRTIQESLSEEQRELLKLEVARRAEFRQNSVADALIAALDRKLFLSPAQRNNLHAPLVEWLKEHELYWQFYYQNPNYRPDFPVTMLAEHLNKEQTRALQRMNNWNYPSAQAHVNNVGQNIDFVIGN